MQNPIKSLGKALLFLRNQVFCLKNWRAPAAIEFICKNKKRPGFNTVKETRFINNSRSKQNKKNLKHSFVDIGK